MVGLLKVKPVCLAALLLAIAVGSGCSSKPDYAFVGALLHNSKAGQQSLRRRFRSVDLLSYRHT